MNLALLGCDDVPERHRHIAGGYRDMFAALLQPHVPGLQLTWIDLYHGEKPPEADAFDGYLCTGSRCSVYEDRPWIASLKNLVREVQRSRKPFVGVCFGHQMLAEALGGKVEKAPQGWGVGVHDMDIVRPENWMSPQQSHCKLQYMHADQVQRMPPQSTLLASAEHCPVAMFRVGETMLGIEGHPEFPASYVEALLLERRERIGDDVVTAALDRIRERTDEKIAGRWVSNFLETAATRA
jgi:GMP synthase-like glutamine amidotransferase